MKRMVSIEFSSLESLKNFSKECINKKLVTDISYNKKKRYQGKYIFSEEKLPDFLSSLTIVKDGIEALNKTKI